MKFSTLWQVYTEYLFCINIMLGFFYYGKEANCDPNSEISHCLENIHNLYFSFNFDMFDVFYFFEGIV
jgi:hypothetical protein